MVGYVCFVIVVRCEEVGVSGIILLEVFDYIVLKCYW